MCYENGAGGQQSSAEWETDKANTCKNNGKWREQTRIRSMEMCEIRHLSEKRDKEKKNTYEI
jgi:hypothetical protein